MERLSEITFQVLNSDSLRAALSLTAMVFVFYNAYRAYLYLINERRSGINFLVAVALSLITLIGLTFVWYPTLFPSEVKLSGYAGQQLYDQFVQVRVLDQVRGATLSAEPYDIRYDIKNRTGVPLYIARIDTRRINGSIVLNNVTINDTVFVNHDYTMKYIGANQLVSATAPGNELLPKLLQITIFHNLSQNPSIFTVDVGGIVGFLAVDHG
ncbi:MAG TPA: hypothetical protein VKG65_12500 [Terriglobales bacterium]|nr:hypothetical protein [Terriglobales bacterium]